ncbi:MAG: hypothetical protein GY778_11080 [bacterium]|nr:hypothetical protein [bacterium]
MTRTLPRSLRSIAAGLLMTCLSAPSVLAQESREPAGASVPDYAPSSSRGAPAVTLSTNGLPHIMITGYWPPTSFMLEPWSQTLNTGGWIGENWEGRGYNIYAFFPEFPGGTEPNWGKGEGDFEVDYQDTSNDWWPLIDTISPISVMTFSRAGNDLDWEIEGGNRNYSVPGIPTWTNDYLDPFKPTPELPSFNEPHQNERSNTHPMQKIVDAVNNATSLFAYIEPLDLSRFLSNYIGYHGNWWHDLHSDPAEPQFCISGGHIHVGYAMSVAQAQQATEITLRVLTKFLDQRRALIDQGDVDGDGVIGLDDWTWFAACLAGPDVVTPPIDCSVEHFDLTDLDNDGDVDLVDASVFSLNFTGP